MYKNLSIEHALQKVVKSISINSSKQLYFELFDTVRKRISDSLCQDPVFKRLFHGLDLAGSAADGIKISKPNEFDFHVYLNFDKFRFLEICEIKDFPGQITINIRKLLSKIRRNKSLSPVYKRLQKLTDRKGYLLPEKINSWIQRLLAVHSSSQFNENGCNFLIKYSRNGPAQTFTVQDEESNTFSMEMVPVLKIYESELFLSDNDPIYFDETPFWVAVSKPNWKCGRSFQTSYDKMERVLLEKKNNLKPVLRLVKRIRDKNGLNFLKSYYIKTVFLWIDDEIGGSLEFWSRPIYDVLMDCLERLQKFCLERVLPFFWHSKENMFKKVRNRDRLFTHLCFMLDKILKKLRSRKTKVIYQIFYNREERKKLFNKF